MDTIYLLMTTAMILIGFPLISRQLLIASLRKKGVYPKKGAEAIESAKKLVQSGHPYLAAYCWSKRHGRITSRSARFHQPPTRLRHGPVPLGLLLATQHTREACLPPPFSPSSSVASPTTHSPDPISAPPLRQSKYKTAQVHQIPLFVHTTSCK